MIAFAVFALSVLVAMEAVERWPPGHLVVWHPLKSVRRSASLASWLTVLAQRHRPSHHVGAVRLVQTMNMGLLLATLLHEQLGHARRREEVGLWWWVRYLFNGNFRANEEAIGFAWTIEANLEYFPLGRVVSSGLVKSEAEWVAHYAGRILDLYDGSSQYWLFGRGPKLLPIIEMILEHRRAIRNERRGGAVRVKLPKSWAKVHGSPYYKLSALPEDENTR